MRKLFTIVAMAVMALAVNAQSYNFEDNLVVTLEGGNPTNTPNTKIIVEEVAESDGLYNITLKDFTFIFPIGDINLENVKGNSDTDGNVWFETANATLQIPLVGQANVTLNEGNSSVMKEGKLMLNLSITANAYGTPLNITAEYGVYKYNDDMLVKLGGKDLAKEPTLITVIEQANGKYTLTLADFRAGDIPVGTIELADLDVTENEGVKNFSYDRDVTIKPFSDGTSPIFSTPIPLTMEGTMTATALAFTINIPTFTVEVYYGASIPTGIDQITTTPNASGVDEIYDLSGRKLNEMQKGINIVRKADGTTVKVLKK